MLGFQFTNQFKKDFKLMEKRRCDVQDRVPNGRDGARGRNARPTQGEGMSEILEWLGTAGVPW